MASLLVAALLVLAHRGRAGVINRSERAHGSCQQLTIPVFASASSAVYDIPPVDNDIDAVAYAIRSDTWSAPAGPQAIIKNTTTEGTFNIHAQLCVPSSSSGKGNILQIATHGLHYDSRYWDPELNRSTNSYVEAAMGAGYSILTYDRLGVGQSDKPDAYTIVQAPLQLEILHQLTLMARNGSLYTTAKTATPNTVNSPVQSLPSQPSKVIHVGHSFGSVLTSAYIATHGSYSEAAIITGYIPNPHLGTVGAVSFALEYAGTTPGYTDRTSGYMLSTKPGIQTVFFGGNPHTAYTPELLSYGDSIKQPITVGEYTSAYTIAIAGNIGGTDFKGPLQYVLPEFDFYICQGDCKGVYDVDALKGIFPNAGPLEVKIQPNTGHALPLHNNATAGYQLTFDFLRKNGF